MREKFPETLTVLPSLNLLCLNIQNYRDDSDFIEYKSVHIIKIKLENQCNLIHMKEKHDLIKVSVMILQRGQLYTKLGLQKPRHTWLERRRCGAGGERRQWWGGWCGEGDSAGAAPPEDLSFRDSTHTQGLTTTP